MMFGKNKTPYSVDSGAKGSWHLSTIAVLFLVFSVVIAIFAAYFLGLRAGQSSGLELANQNSLAQVMRMPVSKAIEEKLSESNEASQDIYEELGRISGIKTQGHEKIEKVSEDVKQFLQVTPTAVSTSKAVEEIQVPQVSPKKIENVNAIKQALEQVNKEQNENLEASLEDNTNIRVINDPNQSNTEGIGSPVALENFDLEQEANSPKTPTPTKPAKTPTPDPKKIKKPTATPTAVLTKTPKPTIAATFKKLNPGWYTQVAAPKSLKDAQALSSKLKGHGFKSNIESAQVASQDYFRVLVGPDTSKLAAEQTLSRLRNKAQLPAEPFVRLVK
jgi:cell division septation protein DedD